MVHTVCTMKYRHFLQLISTQNRIPCDVTPAPCSELPSYIPSIQEVVTHLIYLVSYYIKWVTTSRTYSIR